MGNEFLVGTSPAMLETAAIIERVAGRRATVLITGETGSGKEMVARAIHQASPRAHMAMVVVNAAALPESLIEAELFGHIKGAFTGAVQHRIGRFEQANGSTLFLDEIGDLPLEMQTKLLRFLQEREFQRVGSSQTLRVDVRLIAATNVDLTKRVEEGKFREDLFYRLNVVPIVTPPLRDRVQDIPLLARHLVKKVCAMEQIPARVLNEDAMERLQEMPWPGNVRQLENAIEMAVALSGDRLELGPADFHLGVQARSLPAVIRERSAPGSTRDFDQTIGQLERQLIDDAMRQTHGNKTAAAELLGLKRTTLSAKLRAFSAAA
ncbi:MAG: sigma-54 dependent transcriptional regulator [Acidobacteriota bacterium]